MADRIKGILFDLGDTLLDFGRLDVPELFKAGARRAYEFLRSLGQPLPPFAYYHRRQLWSIRWRYFRSRLTNREFNSLHLLGDLSKSMGHQLTDEQLLDLSWEWYQPLSRCATIEDGTAELLAELGGRGLTLGIVSNTFVPSQVLDRHLQREGLLEHLPHRTYSCDVGYRKPHPRIFRTALDKADLQAGRTIFVGDLPRPDVYGARRMGMIAVLKDPVDRYARASIQPDHRIRSLRELPDVLAACNGG